MKIEKTRAPLAPLHDGLDVSGRVHATLRRQSLGFPCSRTFYIDSHYGRPQELQWYDAQDHPRRIQYRAPAAPRAIAMALEHPGSVICGLSALAVYGIGYFADSCDTTLHWKVSRRTVTTDPFTPTLTRDQGRPRWTVVYRGAELSISPPADAVVEALRQIRREEHLWHVFSIPGLGKVTLRAIQLVDAARRQLNIPTEDIRNAARNRLQKAWVEDVLRASSALADSPKETEMRLICQQVCKEYGLQLVEQWPLFNEHDKQFTTLDLAIPQLMIGLMYDGKDHYTRAQRDKDSRINVESAILGWAMPRFTSGNLSTVAADLERLIRKRSAE